MSLGYCMTCGKLCPIRARGQSWTTRQIDWVPHKHDYPEVEPFHIHSGCGEVVAAVDVPLDYSVRWYCEKHADVINVELVTPPRGPCEGHKHAIK